MNREKLLAGLLWFSFVVVGGTGLLLLIAPEVVSHSPVFLKDKKLGMIGFAVTRELGTTLLILSTVMWSMLRSGSQLLRRHLGRSLGLFCAIVLTLRLADAAQVLTESPVFVGAASVGEVVFLSLLGSGLLFLGRTPQSP